MAQNREAVGADLGPLPEIRKASAHIFGEVGAGRALERATRSSESTVVHAEHRDPAARQRIRELTEGPKSFQPDTFVAVLRTRSGDGDDRAHRLRSEEHTSELQSQSNLVCRLLLEKKKKKNRHVTYIT